MVSPIAVYLTRDGELCAEDDLRQAFLLVGKGGFINDQKAKKYQLSEYIEGRLNRAVKIVPAPEQPDTKSLQIVQPKNKRGSK